jgi:4-amino-4-deoxy-L-arabinose transferase-like glycosyltransferase
MNTQFFNKYREYFFIISVILVSTAVLYIPFLFKLFPLLGFDIQAGFDFIYQSYDGLLYVVPAKTFYNLEAIRALHLEIPLNAEYYAAHLPLYPAFIALFAIVFGYVKSMIVVNLLFTIVLACFFYYLLIHLKLSAKPLILVSIFLFLPRFLVIRSVGAPESLFILLILASVFFFEKKNYLLAGILGGLSVMTKTPGILLFGAYGLIFLEQLIKTKKFDLRWLNILFIPLGLILVFVLYHFQYQDFFAYFHTGGVVPMPYPFSAFNFQGKWVDTAWLEDIILYFFIYGLAIIHLKDSKYRSFFYVPLVYLIGTIFVQHRDISRYALPLWPFACIAFEKFFTSKKFLIVFVLLLPAIYLYAWNFLLYNVMPISDWTAFL